MGQSVGVVVNTFSVKRNILSHTMTVTTTSQLSTWLLNSAFMRTDPKSLRHQLNFPTTTRGRRQPNKRFRQNGTRHFRTLRCLPRGHQGAGSTRKRILFNRFLRHTGGPRDIRFIAATNTTRYMNRLIRQHVAARRLVNMKDTRTIIDFEFMTRRRMIT